MGSLTDDTVAQIENSEKETGDKTVIPPTAPYYIDYQGVRTILDPYEKAEYQKTTGDIISEGVNGLMENPIYSEMTKEEKAEVLNMLYEYANATAKAKLIENYGMQSQWAKAKEAEKGGIPITQYLLTKQMFREIDNDSGVTDKSGEKRYEVLLKDDTLTPGQKELLDDLLISDRDTDYSSEEALRVSLMTDAAQKKWPDIQKMGYTAAEYSDFYGIVSSKEWSKEEKITQLKRKGLSDRQARKVYSAITKKKKG